MYEVNESSLISALQSMLKQNVFDVQYALDELQGGTLANVFHVYGEVMLESHSQHFDIVLKQQRKWCRFGDPESWHREYEIYQSDLTSMLDPFFKIPVCYHREENETEIQLWLEYVQGVKGYPSLNLEDFKVASHRLAEFQVDFHLRGRHDISYLRRKSAIRSCFDLWSGYVLRKLETTIEGFPDDLRCVLLDYALKANALLDAIESHPLTLCHGDFHHDNLIVKNRGEKQNIYLIDWDSAGYGYMGEDVIDLLMEAFVFTDRDIDLFPLYQKTIMDSYCGGVKTAMPTFTLENSYVQDISALKWGFRIVDRYLETSDDVKQARYIKILQKMFIE